jgi:glutathione synthase/RimK-type ligase-like ATP-grasp enzyme
MKKTLLIRGSRPYIVQQGLSLLTFKDSTFDIRVIYQKNGDGEWGIGKKFVRVAPHGSSISNLSRGGTAETYKKVLAAIFNQNGELIKSKNEELNNICQTVATTLETNSQQIYGELGLDIGIDNEGNLWLIEVNSKPRKTTETDFSMSIVRNTFKRPLQYAIYLAGFSRK